MDNVLLIRHEIRSGDAGTFGDWIYPGGRCFSGELPSRGDVNGISDLPAGDGYKGIWCYSPHFKKMKYLIVGDKKRNGIRVHSATYMGDKSKGYKCQLLGCVALARKIAIVDGQKGLLISRPAVSDFEIAMNGRPFKLKIVEAA